MEFPLGLLLTASVVIPLLLAAVVWALLALLRAVEQFGRVAGDSERKIGDLSRRISDLTGCGEADSDEG